MSTSTATRNGAKTQPRPIATAPSARHPYWRRADGARVGFQELVVGRDPELVGELRERHVQATCELLRAAFAARAGGEGAEARRLFTGAARLCTEPLGHWPAAAMRADE